MSIHGLTIMDLTSRLPRNEVRTMIGTYDIKLNAAKPNMPLAPMCAFKGSPSSLRLLDIPKNIGEWTINAVSVVVKYPNDSIITKAATRVGNVWVATFDGCLTSGKVENGLEVIADGVDEQGNEVNGYVLGSGDIYILNRDATIDPDVDEWYMKYCDEEPTNPHKGDLYIDDEDVVYIWNGEKWVSQSSNITKLSQLENDVGFITMEDLDSTLSTIDGNFEALQSSLSNLEDELDAVEDEVVQARSDLSTLQGTVDGLGGDVRELNSSLTALDGKVDGLEGRMDDAESSISQLSSSLSSYATKGYVDSSISTLASSIPTRVSQLQNDASYTNPTAVKALIGEKERKWNVSGLPAGYEWRTSVSESYNDATHMWYYDISIYNVTLDEYATSSNSPYSSSTQVTTFTITDFRIWPEGSESPLMTFDATATFVKESSAYGFAYEVKEVQTFVDVQVPQTIQGWLASTAMGALQISSELREQDPQHRVWWVYYDYSQEFDNHFKYWACYDPSADTDIAATAFIGWHTSGYTSGEGHAFPWEYSDGEVDPVTMWGNIPDDYPTRQGMPPIGYDHWHDYFASQAANRKIYATMNSDVGVWDEIAIYGYVTLHVLPSTTSYDVIYEDALEGYAPLQKQMTYEGDVLVPNQIDGGWVSSTPAMGRLNLNSSYMSQDTQKRVWWSAQVQYEPEPDTQLYIYVVACYDATNDTFKANIWRDQQEGLPQNLSDLEYTSEWGSFSRASGWASWRDFFYNAPDDEYEVSYGQHTDIELFDHAFVKARWGGLFDVVYEGELVNAYATRQYVDEQIGNVLTEEF